MFGNKKKKKVIEYLKISNDYKYKNEALAYFSSKKLYKEFDDELLIKIVTIIIDENIPFLSSINIAENLYDVIVFNNSNEEISLFLKCLKLIYDSSIKEYYMFNILFNIFENKQLFINLISNVNNYNLSDLVSDKFYNYLITTRKYFIDEFAFYSKALEVLKKVRNCDSLNVDFIIEEEIKIDKMISGVYDDLPTIDDVDNLEKKVKNSSEILSNRIEEITELVNTNLVSIETKISENKKYNKEMLLKYRKLLLEAKQSFGNTPQTSLDESKIDLLISKLSNNTEEKPKDKTQIENIETKFERGSLFELYVNEILNSAKSRLKSNEYILEYNEKLDDICREEIRKELSDKVYKEVGNNITDRYFALYLYSLYNETLDLLNKLIKIIKLSDIKALYLNKNVVIGFERENINYINFISVRGNREVLEDFFNKKLLEQPDLSILLKIYKINPNFELNVSVENLKLVLKYFDIKKLALNDSKLETSLRNLESIDDTELGHLKNLCDLNKDFLLYKLRIKLERLNMIFKDAEIALLDEEKQKKVYYLDLDDITDEEIISNKNTIRNIIYRNSKAKLGPKLFNLLEDFNIDFDAYMSLDYETSFAIYDKYENYKYVKSSRRLKLLKQELKKQKLYKK